MRITTVRLTVSIAGQPIAQRTVEKDDNEVILSTSLHYFVVDHLGSTRALVDHSGGAMVPGTVADYKPFGGYRTAPTVDDTDRGYTGHLHTDGIGLICMNARFYVGANGRFASADILIPDPGSSQSYNRYSYVENQPVNFNDPTGHCRINAETGEFDYATDCTVQEFDQLSWDDRILWMEMFMADTEAAWFYNIIGILEYFRDDPVFSDSKWASYSDAAVLAAIQDGWNLHNGKIPIGTGGAEWQKFFDMWAGGESDNKLLQQWGIAEQSGVDYGLSLGNQFVGGANLREQMRIETFVGFGNIYRSIVSDGSMFIVEPTASDYQFIIDASISLASSPLLDPRTGSSQSFVREFRTYPKNKLA